jgi:hypothetical protein
VIEFAIIALAVGSIYSTLLIRYLRQRVEKLERPHGR